MKPPIVTIQPAFAYDCGYQHVRLRVRAIAPSNAGLNQIKSTGYSYDAAGNVTSDGFHTYTYDAEGNVTAVDGGSTAQYVYNALNQRVSENLGGTTTQFAYNVAGQRVSTWNTASPIGQLAEQYYVGSQRVAYFANSALHFQHQDWTGTERMRTTFNGAAEGSFTSLPFGDAFGTVSGIDGDPYHYGKLDHDYTSDTDHAQFRQYSSTPGRWMSPDPYYGSYNMRNPQSFNRYSYVLNNPLFFIDPKGLDDACDDPAIVCFTDEGAAPLDTPDADDFSSSGGYTEGVVEDTAVEGTYVMSVTTSIYGGTDTPDSSNVDTVTATDSNLLLVNFAPNEFQNIITTLMTHYPFNGNVLPLKSQPQDGVCTTGPLAGSMNSVPSILACCQAHDACYAKYGCNASSFLPGGFPGPCQTVCNATVEACIFMAH